MPFLYAVRYNYIKLQLLCIVDMNGCTVWYRLDVAVHNYSYLIIQINNYNELPTFLLKGTRHKQNSLSGNTLFNYMPTYTRSQKKS